MRQSDPGPLTLFIHIEIILHNGFITSRLYGIGANHENTPGAWVKVTVTKPVSSFGNGYVERINRR
jgi:hypothetical protein